MTFDKLNEPPPRGLHSWGVVYRDEPPKGAPAVHVHVWIPKEVVRPGIMVDYIEEKLGWKVRRNGGWGHSGSMSDPGELILVYVKVRAREIRAALAEREKADG